MKHYLKIFFIVLFFLPSLACGAFSTNYVQGSGNYRAGDLETVSADVRIPGSSEVTVWVIERLHVAVSGSGNLSYFGTLTIDQSVCGSGKLISLGEK